MHRHVEAAAHVRAGDVCHAGKVFALNYAFIASAANGLLDIRAPDECDWGVKMSSCRGLHVTTVGG